MFSCHREPREWNTSIVLVWEHQVRVLARTNSRSLIIARNMSGPMTDPCRTPLGAEPSLNRALPMVPGKFKQRSKYWYCSDGLAFQNNNALTIGLRCASNLVLMWAKRIRDDPNVVKV